MNTQSNMWSVVLVLGVIALLLIGSILTSFNLYDVIYLGFIIYAMIKFICIRKSHHGLNEHQ